MNEDHYLSTEEVIEYLQVNIRTVYRLIRAGRIPASRVGRQWRVRRADLDNWLALERRGPGTGAQADRPRVLVVDDDESVRTLVAKMLLTADYVVDTASDGPGALALLEEHRYDLIVTDLKMPGMDGLSLIREVRRTTPELPVIIMTAYSTEASAIEAINLGRCNGYLCKPFRMPRMLALAARALGEPAPDLGGPSEFAPALGA